MSALKLITILTFVSFVIVAQPIVVDTDIPRYEKGENLQGEINSFGSDTMDELITFWLQGFKQYYPDVTFTIKSSGSATAPPALINGEANIGPMSRKMTEEEIKSFRKNHGHEPHYIAVCLDALEIYVNQQNPVEKMTMQQIDAIFSNSRRLGYKEDIVFWGQLGAKGKWSFRKINLYGRNNESGTYEFFRQNALKGGTYKEKIVGLATSTALAKSIMMDPYGIGYSGIGFDLPGIKSLAIAETEGMEYYKGTYKNVLQNKYPLSRLLYIYFNREESKKLSPVIREFLKYILSYEGQEMVVKVGYLPLTYKLIKTEREKLGMN